MAAVSVAGGIRIRGRSWCGTHGMWIRVSQAGQGSSVLGFTARHVLGGDAAGSSVLLYEHPEQPGIGVVLNNGPGPAGPSKQAEWEVALYRPPDEVAPLPGVGWDQRVPLCGDEFDERDFEGLSNDDDQLARGRGTRRVAVLTPDGTVEMWLYARGVSVPPRCGSLALLPASFARVSREGTAALWLSGVGRTVTRFVGSWLESDRTVGLSQSPGLRSLLRFKLLATRWILTISRYGWIPVGWRHSGARPSDLLERI